MSLAPEWAILLPLTGGLIAFLARGRLSSITGVFAALVTVWTAAGIVQRVVRHGPESHPIGGWEAPLGIVLYTDGLAAIMLAMTALVMGPVSLYALWYFRNPNHTVLTRSGGWSEKGSFWPLWLFLYAALNALFLSGDVFNLYITLEMVSLSAVGLVVLSGGVAVMAGLRYLLAAVFGSLLYFLGVALLYGAFDTLDMKLLAERVTGGPVAWTSLTLITLGLMIKAALFPFHGWLPFAHANAPAPVSAALSALVVKAPFYLVLRFWVDIMGTDVSVLAGQTVAVLGALAIGWGSFQALRQQRLKLIIAYSTVAQIGYLFLVFALLMQSPDATAARASAWAGAFLYVVAHALAKASMFLSAGTVQFALGSDHLQSLSSLSERQPITALSLGIAGVALVGVPPSGIFVAKWYLFGAAIESGQWWWVLVIGAGSLLTGAYVFRVVRLTFVHGSAPEVIRRAPRTVENIGLALALTALMLGFATNPILNLLEQGALLYPLSRNGG